MPGLEVQRLKATGFLHAFTAVPKRYPETNRRSNRWLLGTGGRGVSSC